MHEYTIAKITTISDMVLCSFISTVPAKHSSCVSYAFDVASSLLILEFMQSRALHVQPVRSLCKFVRTDVETVKAVFHY